MTPLYAIVVTYRRPAVLRATLDRLRASTRAPDRVVVVDNDPSGAGRACVLDHGATYVAAPANLGPAGGFALGLQHLPGDGEAWVLLVDDDDPPPTTGSIAAMLRFAQAASTAHPALAGVGLSGARFDAARARVVRLRDEELTGPIAVDYIAGNAAPAYRLDALRAIGGPRTELFWGFEELDLGLRLRRAGYTLAIDGDAMRAARAAAGRLGIDGRPDRNLSDASDRRYYTTRNLIAILRAHGGRRGAMRASARAIGKPLANLPRTPRAAMAHLALGARAVAHGWFGPLGRTTADARTEAERAREVLARG